MNAKQLKEMAAEEALKTTEEGKIVIEPMDSKAPTINEFQTKTQNKRHKLQSNAAGNTEKRIRVETEVVPTNIYLKTSVAGNAVNTTIGDKRYTIPHVELSKYMEGLTNSIRLYIVQEKQQGS